MSTISKILLITTGILILILGVEVYLYFKDTRKIIPVSKEATTLPTWNPTTNTREYKKLYFDGPIFMGIDSNNNPVVIYYKGIVVDFDLTSRKIVLKNNDKTTTVAINDEVEIFTVLKSGKNKVGIEEIKNGRLIQVDGNSVKKQRVIIILENI